MGVTWVGAGRFGAAPSFTDPSSVAGLLQWYDADDASTFTYSSGSVVSQWNDKSGNANHIANSTVGQQPSRTGSVNGRTSVVFDGTNDFLWKVVSAPPKPSTIFLVAKNTATTLQRTAFIYFGSPGDGRFYRPTGDTINMFQGSIVASGTSWGTTNPHLVAGVFDSASSLLRVNSGSWTSVSAGATAFGTTFSIGSSISASGSPPSAAEYWTGDICEFVAYSGALSSTDRDNVATYLKNRWGTA